MKNVKKSIVTFAIFFCLFIGSLIIWIQQLQKENLKYKKYETVIGEFIKADVYHRSDDTSYKLIYQYYANGELYQVTTNYGTSMIPTKGTPRKIRYYKNNPKEAIIVGAELSEWLFLVVLISLIVSSYSLHDLINLKNKKKEKLWEYLNSILIGFIFFYGFSVIYKLITGTKNLFSIFDMISSYGFPLIIPFILALSGIYIIGYSIYSFFPKKKKAEKEEFELEQEKLRMQSIENNVKTVMQKTTTVISYVMVTFQFIGICLAFFLLLYFGYLKNSNLDFVTFLILLPFIVVLFSALCLNFMDIFEHFSHNSQPTPFKEKIRKIISSLPVLLILVFWFGFLIFFCIFTLKQKKWGLFFFTIPFWIVGIFLTKMLFEKKK